MFEGRFACAEGAAIENLAVPAGTACRSLLFNSRPAPFVKARIEPGAGSVVHDVGRVLPPVPEQVAHGQVERAHRLARGAEALRDRLDEPALVDSLGLAAADHAAHLVVDDLLE